MLLSQTPYVEAPDPLSFGYDAAPRGRESMSIKKAVARMLQALDRARVSWQLSRSNAGPMSGYLQGAVATRYVDHLTNEDLNALNNILRWHSFTADIHGRRFGRPSSRGKRATPQKIPDPRIIEMDSRFGLTGKSVLEVGCFEGIHTVGLAMFGAHVTAVDARIENVVKSIVRAAFYGYHPVIFKCDIEDETESAVLPEVDFAHHVGVLYHLKDPANHLLKLGALVRRAMMIDTHYALSAHATESYRVGDIDVSYMRYAEGGRWEIFSGMYDHAKWLTLDCLRSLLGRAGFDRVEIVQERMERNGPRVLLFAEREAGA
jgi:2-polyprenyl-3-methyl-5-hydroxy-6-metoxy-1,4-benzoquinol methylase